MWRGRVDCDWRHPPERLTFVNDLRLITPAVSLGHDETLVAYEEYPEGPAVAFAEPFRESGLVRPAIGLEAKDDHETDLGPGPGRAQAPTGTTTSFLLRNHGVHGGSKRA
jgi:hypothetical protein